MLDTLVNAALLVFFARLALASAANARRLFAPRYARLHRLCGLVYFLYLIFGVADARLHLLPRRSAPLWTYDAICSLLGLATAYSAYSDFGAAHRRVKNDASGILDEAATVSEGEMLEHCFYQCLNLVQVSYLHLLAMRRPVGGSGDGVLRLALAFATTLPWLWRGAFPVNSFSENYKHPTKGGTTPLIRVLYRLKKYQYLFYKHALLHGLNVSACLAKAPPRVRGRLFRAYWLSLNAAYTHEFFLQTLVKRRALPQPAMLALNKLLMAGSSVAAIGVLWRFVDFRARPASLSDQRLARRPRRRRDPNAARRRNYPPKSRAAAAARPDCLVRN